MRRTYFFDDSVQGLISTLASHHFPDLGAAAREFNRICPDGPVVLLTIDPREGEEFWFAHYFPGIYRKSFDVFPPTEKILKAMTKDTDWKTNVKKFLLPSDLSDLNMNAGWNRPEIYLDENVRYGMSGFALADPGEVAEGVDRLTSDLKTGRWDQNYGCLRTLTDFDLGFQFLTFTR